MHDDDIVLWLMEQFERGGTPTILGACRHVREREYHTLVESAYTLWRVLQRPELHEYAQTRQMQQSMQRMTSLRLPPLKNHA